MASSPGSSNQQLRIANRSDIELEFRIGNGTFSEVHQGSLRGRKCACKVYKKTWEIDDPGFHREVILLNKMKHKNIVEVFGYYIPDREGLGAGSRILVMELAQSDLSKIIYPDEVENANPNDNSGWKVYNVFNYNLIHVIHWAIQIVEALEFLHNPSEQESSVPFIHRDLKPENILMFCETKGEESLEYYTCKLTDFNSSTSVANKTQSCTGTLGFMAPENRKSLSPASVTVYDTAMDIYSFGCVLFCMVHRQSPTQRPIEETMASSNYCTQVPLKNVVLQCLENDPKNRPNAVTLECILQHWKHNLGNAEFKVLESYQVRYNCNDGEMVYATDMKSAASDVIKGTGDTKGKLPELKNEDLINNLEFKKNNENQKTALRLFLEQYDLVDAYDREDKVKEAVDDHLLAQDEYQLKLRENRQLERTLTLLQREQFFQKSREDVIRALESKKKQVEELQLRKDQLCQKIVSQPTSEHQQSLFYVQSDCLSDQ